MSFESRPLGVVGRSAAQIHELGQSILASLDVSTDEAAISTRRSAATSDASQPLLFDPNEEIRLPNVPSEAEAKLRPHVWSRMSRRLGEGHLFTPPSESGDLLASRFAEIVPRVDLDPADQLKEFLTAVEELEPDPEYQSLWKLLSCIAPGKDPYFRPLMGPIQGAQHYFEERFLHHVHRTVAQLELPQLRTADCIRIYVQNRLPSQDGSYPAWPLVYISIRCGDYAAASEFAEKAFFPEGARCDTPHYYLRTVMHNPAYVACRRFPDLEIACGQFLKHGARRKLDASYRYMLMSVAFLCGQINVADALISESAQSWDSLDEFLWFALGCLRSGNGSSSQFDYKRLHSRLGSYQEDYYTENGKHPMRYALVLVSGLQFGSALYYMLSQTQKPNCVLHVVHMAIVLYRCELMQRQDSGDPKQMKKEDVAELVLEYGRRLAGSHSQMAWHYYRLSHSLKHENAELSEQAVASWFVDLMMRSRDVNLVHPERTIWKDLEPDIDRMAVVERTAAQLVDHKEFELAVLLHRVVNQYDAALDVCHKMWAHVLVAYGCALETVQPTKTQKLKTEIKQIWEYINDTLQCPTGETEQLRKIAEVFVAPSNETNRIVNMVLRFEILPRDRTEVVEKALLLKNRFPSILPLVGPLLRIFCRNVRRLDWNGTLSFDKAQLIHRISTIKAFLREMPPPHADYALSTELETTESGLRYSAVRV